MTERSPLVRPLLLALVLAAGFSAVWAVVVFWSSFAAFEVLEPRLPIHSVVVTREGVPLVRAYDRATEKTTYSTLTGGEVRKPEPVPQHDTQLPVPERPSFGPQSWGQRIIPLTLGRPTAEYWYLLADGVPPGTAYFVGYDGETARRIGYLGAKGFQLELPGPADRFSVDDKALFERRALATPPSLTLQASSLREGLIQYDALRILGRGYLLCRDRLVEYDLKARRIRTVGHFPGAFSTSALETWQPATGQLEWDVAIRMPTEVAVLNLRTDQTQRFVLPAEVREGSVHFYQTGPREAILAFEPAQSTSPVSGTDVLRIDSEGRILSRNEVRWPVRWWNSNAPSVFGTVIAAAFPAPLPALGVLPLVHAPVNCEHEWPAAWLHGLVPAWVHLVPVFLLAAALAWECRRIQRRRGAPRTGAWMVFVFLFGVPGLVGYLVHRRWPPMIACEACRTPVPRDRQACLRCGKPFPAPPRTGKEVFA
jgi:hypothetical protein